MTAAVEVKPIDCPHCKGKIEVEIERKPAKVHIEKQEEPQLAISELDAAVERAIAKKESSKPEEKPPAKEEPLIPPHVAKYKCKGCGSLHPNKNFKGLPKGRCDTCGEKFHNKKAGKCPYCSDGEIEELSEDDIADMRLYMPEDQEEHDHEHE